MTNEVSITVRVNDETRAGEESIVEGAKAAGAEAGAALSEGLQKGAVGGGDLQQRVSQALREGRDAEAQALMNEAPSVLGGAGAGGALAQQIQGGGEKAVAAAKSTANDLGSVFAEIYQRGSNASFQLANAMAASWAGIEAETRGLTAAEKQTFSEFNQILASEGRDAAVLFATGQRQAAEATVQLAAAVVPATTELNAFGYEVDRATGQLLLFHENEAPGMLTQVAAAAPEAAAGIEEVGAAAERATGQLELFTEAEIKWTESTNMAQRATTSREAVPAAGSGVPLAGGWAGSDAEARAAKVKGALEGEAAAGNAAKESLGGLAAVMNGPLMQAFWGISSVAYLPMMIGQMIGPVTGWIEAMSGSAQAVQAAQMAAQNLGPAIAQDSGYIGDNTAATIQNILVKSNLADMAQKVGVSQATLIEYAAGEADAQNALTAAYNRKQDILNSSIKAGQTGLDTGVQQELQLQDQKNALDDLTRSTVDAMNTDRQNTQALTAAEQTTKIYTAAVADLVAKQQAQAQQAKMNADAQLQYVATLMPGTRAYTDAVYTQNVALQANAVNQKIAADAQLAYIGQAVPGTAAFSQALKTQQENLLATGYQAGVTAIAMLDLGDAQFNLDNQLLGAVDLYNRSATQANAYNSVLTALDGTTQSLLGSESAFTIALDGVSKAAQANGTSLDVNNLNGAKNIQTFTQLAQAADKAATSVYQNEVQTKGSTAAYQDANAKLEQEKQAFIDAADKAGFNKDAVRQLADELFKLPPNIDTTVNVNTGPAIQALALMGQFAQSEIASINSTPIVPHVSLGGGGSSRAFAGGGVAGAASGGVWGNLVKVGEHGEEYVRLPVGSSVVPNANVNAMAASAGAGAPSSLAVEVLPGGNSAFEQFMVMALRQWVRVRAGNAPNSVQKAFGQSF